MARKKFQYKLVGSIYCPYAVNLFQGEEFITIPGSSFEQLEDIDAFTMSFYRSGFSQHLPSRYQEKNHFLFVFLIIIRILLILLKLFLKMICVEKIFLP